MADAEVENRHLNYLRSVLDCTSDPLFVTEAAPDGRSGHRICFVNDAFTRLTGYTLGDVAGKPPAFLCAAGNNPQVIDEMSAAFARGEKAQFTLLNARKDGSRFRTDLLITPLSDSDGHDRVVAIQRSRPDVADADIGGAEERFQALADNLTEAVLIYRDKQPLFANGAYVALFGYSSMTDALREISPLMNLPLEELAGDGTGGGGRLGLRTQPISCEALRADGAPLQLTMRSHPVNWNGDRATMLTINRDPRRPARAVTPAHTAAPRVAASPHGKTGGVPAMDDPALLHELMDSVPVILAHKSRDLRYTYINQTYADWVGLPRDQIIGRHVCNVRNEAHYQLMKARRTKVLAGETVQYNTKCEFPGRGMCDLLTTLIPQRSAAGEVEGYFSLVQDITDLKDVERALIRREQQFRLIMDSVPVLISYRDRNLRFQYVNRRFHEWHGVRREDMIGRHMTEFIDLELFRRLKPHLDRVLAGEPVRLTQFVDFTGAGRRKVDINLIPHKDENGHVVGFFALTQEVLLAQEAQPAETDRAMRDMSDWSAALLSNGR